MDWYGPDPPPRRSNLTAQTQFHLYATVLLARIALLTGDSSQAIALLADLVLTLDASRRRKIDVLLDGGLGAYGHVVHLMAICTLGQSYLAANNTLSAQECFTLAADQINHKLYQPPSLNTITHPDLRKLAQSPEFSDQYLAWTEESLYSQIAIATPETIAKLTRQYTLYFAQAATPSFRPEKRATVLRLYLTSLANTAASPSTQRDTIISGTTLPPFSVSPFSGLPLTQTIYPPQIPQQVLAEFQSMLPLYESL
ncbi:hypothetical protein HDU99_006757, partial [Rhizoclosmatium hyalinum]